MSNPNRVGLLSAIVLGGCHLVWAAVVALGVGQMLYDFVLWAHMIHLPISVGPFEPIAAITLVLATAVLGYLGGYVGSLVWSRMP